MTIPEAIRPRRPRRETVWIGAGLLLVLLVVGVAFAALRTAEQANRQLQSEKATEASAIGQLSNALQATQNQLKQHGVKPVAPPPTAIIQGVPGIQGIPGIPGEIGPSGPPGKDGISPDPNAIASAAAKLIQPVPGPSGPAGPQGEPGQNSNVPGPHGQPGQPPAGWTTTHPDGSTETCQRAANFDPNNPWYTCTVTPGPSSPPPSPSPSPTPSQSATAQTQATSKPKDTAVVSTGPR